MKKEYSSQTKERLIDEQEEYLTKEEYDFSLKQHVIKRVLLNNFIFFGLLITLSFMSCYIYKYVKGF